MGSQVQTTVPSLRGGRNQSQGLMLGKYSDQLNYTPRMGFKIGPHYIPG